MRVRAQTASGDMTFGTGAANYLVNSPAAVAQLVSSGLQLWLGSFFLDTSAGMDWEGEVLGKNTETTRDGAIIDFIRSIQGVTSVQDYSSSFNPASRVFTVSCSLFTQFSQNAIAFSQNIGVGA